MADKNLDQNQPKPESNDQQLTSFNVGNIRPQTIEGEMEKKGYY